MVDAWRFFFDGRDSADDIRQPTIFDSRHYVFEMILSVLNSQYLVVDTQRAFCFRWGLAFVSQRSICKQVACNRWYLTIDIQRSIYFCRYPKVRDLAVAVQPSRPNGRNRTVDIWRLVVNGKIHRSEVCNRKLTVDTQPSVFNGRLTLWVNADPTIQWSNVPGQSNHPSAKPVWLPYWPYREQAEANEQKADLAQLELLAKKAFSTKSALVSTRDRVDPF